MPDENGTWKSERVSGGGRQEGYPPIPQNIAGGRNFWWGKRSKANSTRNAKFTQPKRFRGVVVCHGSPMKPPIHILTQLSTSSPIHHPLLPSPHSPANPPTSPPTHPPSHWRRVVQRCQEACVGGSGGPGASGGTEVSG